MILQFFEPILGGILFTLLIVPFSIKAAKYFKLVDEPFSAPHKTHKNAAPKAGGMAIFIVIWLISFLGGKLRTTDIYSILLGATIVFIFGIWDDAKGLSAGWKLTGQILAAAILVWQGIYIHMFGHPIPNILMTIFWITGITNAFNLVDSMDGLAVG